MTTDAPVETASEAPAAVTTAPAEVAPTPPAVAPVEAAPPAAAIDYSTLSIPEAIKSEGFVTSVRSLAEQHQMPVAAAQGVLDAIAAEAKASVDGWAAQREAWRTELAADKDVGPQGMAHVKTWLDTYGSAELREMLTETGLGDHPLLVRALVKAGKDAGEAPIVPSNGATPPGPWYDRFYSSVKPTLRN